MRFSRPVCALVARVLTSFVLVLLSGQVVFSSPVFADDPGDQYYSVTQVTLDGETLDQVIIAGPPTPPPGFEHASVKLPEPRTDAGLNTLSDVPAFNWCFGCSATSAAMMAGYYDRTGYGNMYTGPTNGGVMPLDNSSWSDWPDSNGNTRHRCPLSATHDGLDGRAGKGHVDDYWEYYDQPGPDPWDGNWTEHTHGDCTADYMNTNQWVWTDTSPNFNTDGATTFYYYTDGSALPADDLEAAGHPYDYDGGLGLRRFFESRGYTVVTAYNQYIKGQGSNPDLGFTYAQYKAEIDAGRPVMLHLQGHTIVGVGYDDTTSKVYLHDTWDYDTHEMTWGGSYSGMDHLAVTIIQLQSPGEQTWYLHSDDVMYRGNTGKLQGSVEVGAGLSNVWTSDEAAETDITFPHSAWTGQVVFTSAPSDSHAFAVHMGYSEAGGASFQEGGPDATLTGDGDATVFAYTTDADSFTVPAGKYLACRIANNSVSAYDVTTGGAWTHTESPSGDPGYPVPEIATAALLGTGLACLGGYLLVKRRGRRARGLPG